MAALESASQFHARCEHLAPRPLAVAAGPGVHSKHNPACGNHYLVQMRLARVAHPG